MIALDKLSQMGFDPSMYGLNTPPAPDLVEEVEPETLSTHLNMMTDMVMNATTDEVLSFISDMLRLKGM